MKCAIIGGSVIPKTITIKQMGEIKELGKWFANNDIELLTGACGGFPYLLGKACVANGGTVIGYSPAANLDDHIELYKHPTDGCSSIVYLNTESDNLNMRFLLRSIPLMESAETVLCLEGNWGTLFEVVTGVLCGKKQIIWQGFGGISNEFSDIYNRTAPLCKYEYGEKIYFVDNIEMVKSIIL